MKCSRVVRRAHPRSRGEHKVLDGIRLVDSGSSPLTRGAHHHLPRRPQPRRLIPAHAGSTRRHRVTHLKIGAHPRSRGEHVCIFVLSDLSLGSSPLTRGALSHPDYIQGIDGLIPAHAGSTTDE